MNPQPEQESASPVKTPKHKLRGFEKTLTKWVKKQQKKGISIADEDLRKQAQVLSTSPSDQAVASSTSWLDRFKRRNGLIPHQADGETTLVDPRTTSLSQMPNEGLRYSSDGLVFTWSGSTYTGSTLMDPGLMMERHPTQPRYSSEQRLLLPKSPVRRS